MLLLLVTIEQHGSGSDLLSLELHNPTRNCLRLFYCLFLVKKCDQHLVSVVIDLSLTDVAGREACPVKQKTVEDGESLRRLSTEDGLSATT